MTTASCDNRLLNLFLQLFPKMREPLIRELSRILEDSTKDTWLAVIDLSDSTPGHKHMPGVDAFLSVIGDVLTKYVQQQCAGFLQKFSSEGAYVEACQKKSSTGLQSRQETVQSRQASKLSFDEDFVLITHDDVKFYQGPIKRK